MIDRTQGSTLFRITGLLQRVQLGSAGWEEMHEECVWGGGRAAVSSPGVLPSQLLLVSSDSEAALFSSVYGVSCLIK